MRLPKKANISEQRTNGTPPATPCPLGIHSNHDRICILMTGMEQSYSACKDCSFHGKFYRIHVEQSVKYPNGWLKVYVLSGTDTDQILSRESLPWEQEDHLFQSGEEIARQHALAH